MLNLSIKNFFAENEVLRSCISRAIPSSHTWGHSIAMGSVIGPLPFILFVNALADVLEGLTLLFMDGVKMVNRRTQKINFHSCLTAAWVEEVGPTYQSYLTIGREISLRLSFVPLWVWHPQPCIQIRGFRQTVCSLPLLSALKPQIRQDDC